MEMVEQCRILNHHLFLALDLNQHITLNRHFVANGFDLWTCLNNCITLLLGFIMILGWYLVTGDTHGSYYDYT
jgi:hypothetical protein